MFIFTSWDQLDIRCYGNFKVQKFCFKKMLQLLNGDYFFAEGFFKSTYMYSASILRSVLLKLLKKVLKILGDAKILRDGFKKALQGVL